MTYKLYSLDNIFITEVPFVPYNFTGIAKYPNGIIYYSNGGEHRLDGPAVEYTGKYKDWYINNKQIICNTNEEFKLLIDLMKLKGLL